MFKKSKATYLMIGLALILVFILFKSINEVNSNNGVSILISKISNTSNEEFLNNISELGEQNNINILFSTIKDKNQITYSSNPKAKKKSLSFKHQEIYDLQEATNYYFGNNATLKLQGTTTNISNFINELESDGIAEVKKFSNNDKIFDYISRTWFVLLLIVLLILILSFLEVNDAIKVLEEKRIKKINGYKNVTLIKEYNINSIFEVSLIFIVLFICGSLLYYQQILLYSKIFIITFVIFLLIYLIINLIIFYILKPQISLINVYKFNKILKFYNVIKLVIIIISAFMIIFLISISSILINLSISYHNYQEIADYIITPINTTENIDIGIEGIRKTGRNFKTFYEQTVNELQGIAIYPMELEESTFDGCMMEMAANEEVDMTEGEGLAFCDTVYINDNSLAYLNLKDLNNQPIQAQDLNSQKIEVFIPQKYQDIVNINDIIQQSVSFNDKITENDFEIIYIKDDQNKFMYNSYLINNPSGYVKDAIYINFNPEYMADDFFYGLNGNSTRDYFVKEHNINAPLQEANVSHDVVNYYSKSGQAMEEVYNKMMIVLKGFIFLSISFAILCLIFITIINSYFVEHKKDIALKYSAGWKVFNIYEPYFINLCLVYTLILIIGWGLYIMTNINILYIILGFLLLELLSLVIYHKCILKKEILNYLKRREN
ncbi:MAG: hypothetical protein ACK5HR_03175 [Mycoplasmatales bacterium]